MSESQDLYADSDLAPLSELFGEMGNDRSYWRKLGDRLNLLVNFSALGGLRAAFDPQGFLNSFPNSYDNKEVARDLANIGQTRDRFSDSPDNAFFVELTSFRRSEIDHLKDEKNRTLIFEKIYQSGLLDLADMAGGLREFARLRFQDAETIRKSASDYSDPVRDTMWLEKLIQAKDYFFGDPLALATVYKYFPNLYKLFVTGLAATADYGYSEEDPLNNHQQIIEQMFKSFGTRRVELPNGTVENKAVFEPVWAIENFTTAQKIEKAIKETAMFTNTPPVSPDIFHLRIGAANFYVPPITIGVNTGFKTGSLTGGAIRQKASPKFNSGHRETTISIKLYFPNYEEIWGISIDDATKINLNSNYFIDFKETADEKKVDKFLSSLRGLIAAFKYAPILPIKNHYINSVFDITGVALTNMTISTVPNFPFTLEVDLELSTFNHKPYLPMIKDFNQAIHWGKFRYYMGRAAGSLANAVNAEFLLNTVVEEKAPFSTKRIELPNGTIIDESTDATSLNTTEPYKDGVLTTNVMNDWINGKNITLYIPAEVQSKIYSPDVASFRSEEEKAVGDYGRAFWENLLYKIGIDVTDETLYRSLDTVQNNSLAVTSSMTERQRVAKIVDVALAGVNAKNVYEQTYDILVIDYINSEGIKDPAVIDYLRNRKSPNEVQVPAQTTEEETEKLRNKKWDLYIASQSIRGLLRSEIEKNTEKVLKRKKIAIDKESKEWKDALAKEEQKYIDAFTVSLYERVYKDESIQSMIGLGLTREANQLSRIDGRIISAFNIREWEVPMMKIDLDEKSVIVNGVTVSMGNNMAKLQLQMQEEPTFQYIGSKDSIISISMTVFGETELIKIRKMFDYLSGLARLEKAAGVIGFMGIKNIVCALAGIKYVLPLNYSVQTVEGYPHVYAVNLTLVDFDIFQQKRENISSEQQISMIREFGSKRNPFLRLKQKWGAFNAYPDMPLSVIDPGKKEVVGSLDPDFYFRSFEMYDYDVVNNIIDPENYSLPVGYYGDQENSLFDSNDAVGRRMKSHIYFVKKKLIENNGNVEEIKNYLMVENNLTANNAMTIVRIAIFDQQNEPEFATNLASSRYIANKYPDVWKDFIASIKSDGVDYDFDDVKFNTRYGNVRIGDVISGSKSEMDKFNKLITDSMNEDPDSKEPPSFDPDDVDHFGVMYLVPAADQNSTNKIPAIYQTPDGGYVLGYSNTDDGRFYLSQDFLKVSSDGKFIPTSKVINISDTQTPERDPQDSHTGVPGAKSLSSYQTAYASPTTDKMESVSTGGTHKGVAKHWQKMMMDTQYRDLSGRMIRAYPTYMLWLIDDSNFFAGVKLFDNFYGLQSVIDFSIVQSEDILGDTLMLRVSNTYSKLSKPEGSLTSIVSPAGKLDGGVTNSQLDTLSSNLASGTAQIIQTLINRSMNLSSHMNPKYVTEIAQIRLKPGVRVHLRAGYGGNPNSLQTIFNGVITEVDHGEILTIVAQSDAIELSPMINSVNKKGDSGKIDGGINTGLWMSEPRDLMVRLLSMGASRTREAFAHATRGAVFSENKFGIRHFGSILYEPLTDQERARVDAYKQSVVNAFNAVGKNPISGASGAYFSATNPAKNGSALYNMVSGRRSATERPSVLGAMSIMWSNFSTQRDIELFKRNIYPGNGIGVAQFLGGDLDDGWATMASVDISEIQREKFGYMDRLSDSSWSGLLERSQDGNNIDANQVLDKATSGSKLIDSSGAVGTTQVLTALSTGLGGGIILGTLGRGLLKSSSGRGRTNLFKTLGIVSDLDDDIYDEVSFRAQTYMRSIWDIFQLCARLLPNYIVAVRPFEDRSTIFYGKPHWLYTSGVFPISTGFPSDDVAQREGISTPNPISPDDSLQQILNAVNKDMSPGADAAGINLASESGLAGTIMSYSKDMLSFSGIFTSGKYLKGKVIDFSDVNRTTYYDKNKKPISKLPVTKGKVQVGFHLPFGSNGVSAPFQIEEHLQVSVLPIRYRYPFFTNRTSGTLASLDFDRFLNNSDSDYEITSGYINKTLANVVQISLLEKELITGDRDAENTVLVNSKNGDEYSLNFNFDFAQKLNFVSPDVDTLMRETAVFDPSGIFDPEANLGTLSKASNRVQMPLPIRDIRDTILEDGVKFNETFEKYYGKLDPVYNLQQDFSNIKLDFTEWGMPKTAEEEQFYIAMRWPYDPIQAKMVQGLDKELVTSPAAKDLLNKFKKLHGLEDADLVGTPEEYKKRRVLVYNERTKSAVVCAPAYFLWGETEADGGLFDNDRIEAIVSPDAAYFLGLLVDEKGRITAPMENIGMTYSTDSDGNPQSVGVDDNGLHWEKLGMVEMNLAECRFTFVPDNVPVGVVTTSFNPANRFTPFEPGDPRFNPDEDFIVGFGAFKVTDSLASPMETGSEVLPAVRLSSTRTGGHPSLTFRKPDYGIITEEFTFSAALELKTAKDWQKEWSYGGNYIQYYDKIIDNNLEELSQEALTSNLEEDKQNSGDDPTKREQFTSVYDPLDSVSVTARGFYDEDFDSTVRVIAGNGRTLQEAQNIWDQFRYGYHNYDSVKNIFEQVYGLDPDLDDESKDPLFLLLTGKDTTALDEFGTDKSSSEFTTLLGADWIGASSAQTAAKQSAIDIAIEEYVDGGYDGRDESNNVIINKDKGLIDAYNAAINAKVRGLKKTVQSHFETYEYHQTDEQESRFRTPEERASARKAEELLKSIKTPKQLFLLIVGIFRQKLWSDPYARAWLVLAPDRKRFRSGGWTRSIAENLFADDDEWSFRSIDRAFHAFIDYNAEYASNSSAFIKFLERNAKEGSSSGNWVSGVFEDADKFWDKNVGPIFSAFDAALGGLLNMFRMSMAQMGYGLDQLENFTKQANILNKAYNDSIYYSLGRPGSLLRAVDNPFTREYGEPVVEIREPFQRLHYLSSFSHILTNSIQENGRVATQITAVSDGKYPVTVSLDKAAPPERQVEKTVETGLFFDNARGEGFLALLHPIMHPMETARGIAKYAQGEPDEITARRVALAHLKESLKDIYGGEIIVVGNPDIRPHDLVYLADVYERMYGIFEVEQVVHHFTPENGFVTSITPNAFVTVNDPARWFMSSWISSHFSMQNLRNDTRLMLANKSNNSALIVNGDVSIDNMADMLKDQMLGGLQYTHGHTALLRDIQANHLADSLPDTADKIKALVKSSTGRQEGGAGMAVFAGLVMPTVTATATAAATIFGTPLIGAAVAAAGTLATEAIWSGWKWVRDNVIDQHGCYIQYLSKNGQPMDAGLSSFQGMIVGRYHSKKLLPGILGVRTKVRTSDGYAYIRSDDLLRSIGWKEKEITDLVRQISLENAIVHSEILKYSGIGPEKTGLNQFFKAIVKVEHISDGDTMDVQDVISGIKYRVRFDGINTSELNKLNVTSTTAIINPNSAASKALNYTKKAVDGVLCVLRISPNNPAVILTTDDYEAGSTYNNPQNYLTAIKGKSYANSDDRYMATVFYRTDEQSYNSVVTNVRKIFTTQPDTDMISFSKEKVKELMDPTSVLYTRFDIVYDEILANQEKFRLENLTYNKFIHFETTGTGDPLNGLSNQERKAFDAAVGMLVLYKVYNKASEWPMAEWNEYYNDASPITLNWELVVNGLAKIYTTGLSFIEGAALETPADLIPVVREVER